MYLVFSATYISRIIVGYEAHIYMCVVYIYTYFYIISNHIIYIISCYITSHHVLIYTYIASYYKYNIYIYIYLYYSYIMLYKFWYIIVYYVFLFFFFI